MSSDESQTASALPLPGSPFPLGALPGAGGTQFAVHAPHAELVQVCLISPEGHEQRVDLTQQTYGIWHGIVGGTGPGQRYGYRAHGPWRPRAGLRINPAKILLDPSARQLAGSLGDARALLSYDHDPFGDPSTIDSLGHTPLSVVTAPLGVRDTPRLETPWEVTVLYELHVGSFTARHPDVPPRLRGTYLGLCTPVILDYLVALGITAVELLPVHAFLSEPSVRARGMRNHWGYSTASFFAPHPGYATAPGREIPEFRQMVQALHGAGIEVILDVVFNHTCEAGVDGPTLSWRGLDAPGYYQLDDDGLDIDLTGCANTIDAHSPAVVRMVCNSLRYWVSEMDVDGYRFDLASALGRRRGATFDPTSALFTAITSDPVLARCKLIAEPWDATELGYQVGNFGTHWSEWNDRYRSTIRRFWAGHTGVRELASRIAGSEDLYGPSNRKPWASINFITAHDGFTAADLVSFAHKHNEANGEHNRDGAEHNDSVNHGVEGPTEDPDVLTARARHVRALLATLLLSTGTPMLLAGDELGHSQNGNNNAYCVPAGTPVTDAWPIEWTRADPALTTFVTRALALRRAAPVLRQREFFDGRDTPTGNPDLVWFGADGVEMDVAAWQDDSRRTLQAWVDGSDVRAFTRDGRVVEDTSGLLLLHAGPAATVTLGCPEWYSGTVRCVFDSSTADGAPADRAAVAAGSTLHLTGPTLRAFRATG